MCVCGQDLREEALQKVCEEDRDRRTAEGIAKADLREWQRLSAMNEEPSSEFSRALQVELDAEQAAEAAEVSERGCSWAVRPPLPRPHAPTHGCFRGG